MATVDSLKLICDRLAPLGWGDFLSQVTGGAMEIRQPTAAKLETVLLGDLPQVDRSLPGLDDFHPAGRRGITAGQPGQSLLYHALASPLVTRDHQGRLLQGFATPAELETVENFVFAARKVSLSDLRKLEAKDAEFAVMAFASEYRPASDSVDGNHADLVFSRTGIGRIGTARARYQPEVRGFWSEDEDNAHNVRVIPVRFSPWLAVRRKGSETNVTPILDNNQAQQSGEVARSFWVPVHKLFAGPECLTGLNLTLQLTVRLFNLKIQRIQKALGAKPLPTGLPYVLTDAQIAAWSTEKMLGGGWLMPTVHESLVQPALLNGAPVTYRVKAALVDDFAAIELPGKGEIRKLDLEINPAPSYVHGRTKVSGGQMLDLNDRQDLLGAMREADYDALHYVDFTGEGPVQATVPELAAQGVVSQPGYALVSAPDLFPATGQFQLSEWSRSTEIPQQFQGKLWNIPPTPLSETRLPANLQLPASPFEADDVTITAVVGMGAPKAPPAVWPKQPVPLRAATLPDDAAGVFAPGWDVGVDRLPSGKRTPHLAGYSLGSPFPEDAKLCAALSTFWPAVAPDVYRTFATSIGNTSGTIAPLTDEEIGQAGVFPWDGLPGPRLVPSGGVPTVELADFLHADYVRQVVQNRLTIRLLARIGVDEYQARILAMCRVYSVLAELGDISLVRNDWLALSFRTVSSGDPVLQQAQGEAGTVLHGPVYSVTVCANLLKTDAQTVPGNPRLVRFPARDLRLFLASPTTEQILTRRDADLRWAAAHSEA